ncbi:uroporphyrinogen III synthase HEM4 [Methylocella silvestris BL2]|uniref:Uroporphyrinogen III synthase HEM4 n=1 Tax=Methylocella silvestris (strain DSM 15510 / CIP 108128 / LMG 27833 / NCIMB 13906 / BL2) TaxID=395965 RepID=B8EJI7_METSB|nr:uroporphyrinogen-III synthase [Methylocella silvestris]ACK48990.1 uroporphyrinogen III synthase HEM4 [Methylocella silvestris BL2]
MLVLLTRAFDEAMRTAAKLTALGHHAILSPVLEMAPTGAEWPQCVVDGALATSTQAFELLSQSGDWPSPEARRLTPLHVVGERTKAAARERGFEGRTSVAPDAKILASSLIGALAGRTPSRFVYLAGRDRKPDLEAALTDAGHSVDVVEVYAAQALDALDTEAAALIEAGQIGAILHYSRRSADIFLRLAAETGLDISRIPHVAISADAAAPLKAARFPSVHIAEIPNEQGMLDALQGLAHQESVDRADYVKS